MLDTPESKGIITDTEMHRCRIEAKQINCVDGPVTIWEIPSSETSNSFLPHLPRRSGPYQYQITIALDANPPQWIFTFEKPRQDNVMGEMLPAFKALFEEVHKSDRAFVDRLKTLAVSLHANNTPISVTLTQWVGERIERLYSSPPVAAAASGSSGGAAAEPEVLRPQADSDRLSISSLEPALASGSSGDGVLPLQVVVNFEPEYGVSTVCYSSATFCCTNGANSTGQTLAVAASGSSSTSPRTVTPMRDGGERASRPEITPDSERCLIM